MTRKLSLAPDLEGRLPNEGPSRGNEDRKDQPVRSRRSRRVVNVLLLLMAGLGLLDAGMLTCTHLSAEAVCGPESGCTDVLSSSYSRVLGVPLSVAGLGVYLAIALLARRAGRPDQRPEAIRWIFRLSLLGNLVAPYLLYLQAVVIEAWCPFCLASTGLMAGILFVSLWDRVTRNDHRSLLRAPRFRTYMKPILGSLLLPPLLFATADRLLTGAESKALELERTVQVVARVGDRTITAKEMDRALRTRLHEIEWERYEAREKWLEDQLLRFEADRRGLSVRDLLRDEVHARISITKEQIDRFYRENRQRFPRHVRRDALDRQIAAHLRTQEFSAEKSRYLARLMEETGSEFLLSKPVGLTLEPNPRGGPEQGPVDAPLTIIAFSDFECPYCAKAHRRLKDFVEKHPEQVRLVFRHFPLEIHENARPAAYAAACAQRQGKFWDYADVLFEHGRELSGPKLYEYAAEAGLDVAALKRCVDSGDGRTIVEADLDEGSDLGIRSTPSFFINGRYFSGLPSEEELASLLDG